jgi:hypothetical protein
LLSTKKKGGANQLEKSAGKWYIVISLGLTYDEELKTSILVTNCLRSMLSSRVNNEPNIPNRKRYLLQCHNKELGFVSERKWMIMTEGEVRQPRPS